MKTLKEKNILLTTMSTLNNVNINYYADSDNDSYCSGISQLEAGTKYYLSDKKYDIDKIVVIGSGETISKGDNTIVKNEIVLQKNYDDLIYAWNELYSKCERVNDIKANISAYEFYRIKIAEFCMGKNSIEESIAEKALNDEERKSILEKIVDDEIKDSCSMTDDNIIKEISKKISKSISDEFVWNFKEDDDVAELKGYVNKLAALYEDNNAGVDEIKNLIDEFKEEVNSEKQYYYMINNINRLLYRSNIERVTGKIELINEKINEIKRENERLNKQLNDLRNNRIVNEKNYATYYYYNKKYGTKQMKYASNHDVSMCFVDDKVTVNDKKVDNLSGIIAQIGSRRGEQSEEDNCGDETCINLYIDVQGGDRTSAYVRNAIIQIIENQEYYKVSVKKIVSVGFKFGRMINPIVDETERFKITDLVSGMNTFIRYGRADLLKKYRDDMKVSMNSSAYKLIEKMDDFDKALSICNVDDTIAALEKLKETIDNNDGAIGNSGFDNIFNIIKDGIWNDYQYIWDDTGEISIVNLVEWCVRKEFLQQATTLVESKMPNEIVRTGILFYLADGLVYNYPSVLKSILNHNDLKMFGIDAVFFKRNIYDSSAGLYQITEEEKLKKLIEEAKLFSRIDINDSGENNIMALLELFSSYFALNKIRNGMNHGNSKENITTIKNACIRVCDAVKKCKSLATGDLVPLYGAENAEKYYEKNYVVKSVMKVSSKKKSKGKKSFEVEGILDIPAGQIAKTNIILAEGEGIEINSKITVSYLNYDIHMTGDIYEVTYVSAIKSEVEDIS